MESQKYNASVVDFSFTTREQITEGATQQQQKKNQQKRESACGFI